MAPLLAAWPVLIAVIAVSVAGLRGLTASRGEDPVRHVRGRLWLALGVFGFVLIGALVWTTSEPALLGLPIVVGPGAAAAAAVLVFALPPARARSGARRSASLRSRSAAQVVGGRVLVLPGAVLLLLVAVLVATGVTAVRTGDAAGRSFAVERAAVSAGGGPYPGWFYGVPILITAIVLVLAVVVAVRRTVLLPALTADDAADGVWRAAVGRTLSAIATAGLLLYLAGVLWAAGVAWQILEQTGTSGLGPVMVVQGLVSQLAAVAALVLLVTAAMRVAAIGRSIARKPVVA